MHTVTGATGLLGAHLVARLRLDNQPVRVLYRRPERLPLLDKVLAYAGLDPQQERKQLDLWALDLRDYPALEEALSGTQQLFHCAALVSFDPRDKGRLLEDNPKMTSQVVDAALRQKVKHLVYVSSVAALGRKPGQNDFDENNHWIESRHNTAYAKSKYRAELEVWRGIEEGLPAAIVNPAIILGPGFWREGSSALIDKVARGFPFYTEGVNGFVDVRDVAEVMVRLAQESISTERYVLAAENRSYAWLFAQIAEALGQSPPSFRIRPWMAELAWRLEEVRRRLSGKKPVITKETARTAQQVYRYHSEKVKAQLSFSFRPLEETIAYLAELYLQDHSGS